MQAQQASSAGFRGVRALAVRVGTFASELTRQWWPRLRYHARGARVRGLSLESTAGQVIAAASVSVIAAYVLVAFG